MTQLWEIENFLYHKGGHLMIDGVDAVELAARFGTPLFVFSELRIERNVRRILAIREKVPRPLKVCYAAKAMPTLGVLRAVGNAGADIEVNSGGELWKALKAGFRGDQIIFNGTSKEDWEIELAIANTIYAIQVDSLYELELIEEIAGRLNRRANVSLRLVPEIESPTHSGLQTALLTSKFGMMPEEALSAFSRFKDSANLNIAGIHLHIGSQNPDPAVYTEAFTEMYRMLRRIYDETGNTVEHVNLGGGFPVNYLRDISDVSAISAESAKLLSAEFEPSAAIADAWQIVSNLAIAEDCSALLENITLLLEPGRSIVADAGICLTTVRNWKERPTVAAKTGEMNRTIDSGQIAESPRSRDVWLLTDAGFNLLLSMATYKWYYQLISAARADEPHTTPYKVAGPLCDGGDVYFDVEGERRLPDYRLLPANVCPGEVLALLNCGAYSVSQASQYNGRPLPSIVLINKNGEPQEIRSRENLEDLIRGEI